MSVWVPMCQDSGTESPKKVCSYSKMFVFSLSENWLYFRLSSFINSGSKLQKNIVFLEKEFTLFRDESKILVETILTSLPALQKKETQKDA